MTTAVVCSCHAISGIPRVLASSGLRSANLRTANLGNRTLAEQIDDAAPTIGVLFFRTVGIAPTHWSLFEGELESRLLVRVLTLPVALFALPDLLDNERGQHRSLGRC